MNRPTELIETLERLLKLAIDGTPISYADHAALEEATSYGSLQKLTYWLEVLERALEMTSMVPRRSLLLSDEIYLERDAAEYKRCVSKAARELEARDELSHSIHRP